jgi:mRNA-degrading endonuclease toxin of MazEF toxin-antitoxin module
MKKGEVWRVRLPVTAGHKQSGERPGVIMQDDQFLTSLPTVLIVPFTGTVAASRFPGTLLVQPDGQNGLTVPSVALVFQFSAVDQRDCVRRLGTLDGHSLDELFALLDQLTGR